MSSPMSLSSKRMLLARLSSGPHWVMYHLVSRFITLWYQQMWLSTISPLRGSMMCGP